MIGEAAYYIKIRIRCPSNYDVWLCMDYVSTLLYIDRFDGTVPRFPKYSDSIHGLSFRPPFADHQRLSPSSTNLQPFLAVVRSFFGFIY
ncbi:Hypothetical predicted protein [Pelobates cultripes]|uniref:Uncharacterized protein n=1 Tax=Pelobates cultripes TaxID=61616 RepID=A0AAD1W258_PELCU|nr:Hypothetical predicted protein [Pelobates cultripes]